MILKERDMMEKVQKAIFKMAEVMNRIAGWTIVVVMVLVVVNVILRRVFRTPILGTYEFVGFLSVLVIGLGIAYCMVQKAHIAIDFIFEKFSATKRKIMDVAIYGLSSVGIGIFSGYMFRHATRLAQSGRVSITTQTPFYIFVYILGVCFVVLSLVLLAFAIDSGKGVKQK